MQFLMTEKVVELVFMPPAEVARWFNRIGLEATLQSEDMVILRNPYIDFVTALYETDPCARAVCLAWALVGHVWPQVFPTLLKDVNREWKRRTSQEKANKKKEPDDVELQKNHLLRYPFRLLSRCSSRPSIWNA